MEVKNQKPFNEEVKSKIKDFLDKASQEGKVVNLRERNNSNRYDETHEPKNISQLRSKVAELTTQLGTMSKEDKIVTEEFEKLKRNVAFLSRVADFAEIRQSKDSSELLFPTNSNGIKFLYDEFNSLYDDMRKNPEFFGTESLDELRDNVEFLRKLSSNQSRKKKKKKGKRTRKDSLSGRLMDLNKLDFKAMQLPDGQIVHVPKDISVFDEEKNVLGDSKVLRTKKLPTGEVVEVPVKVGIKFVDDVNERGGFSFIFRRVDKVNGQKFAIMEISSENIAEIRLRRYAIAEAAGIGMLSKLIRRDMGSEISKRIKKPETIIERYGEDYLSHYSTEIVIRDISFMINNYNAG